MARYQIILAYDGTHFLGSQRQGDSRTVQGELEAALQHLGWDGKSVILAGRTDTGTHASGQVAAFDLEWRHGDQRLERALNGHLPHDMAVRQAGIVPQSFNPRFDAASRTYQYRLFSAPIRDPLRERYAWRVWPAVSDLGPMASIWHGKHDFSSFGSPTHAKGSTIRTVMDSIWRKSGDEWTYIIKADAFLYRMVRRIVYVQVLAAQERLSPDAIVRALCERDETGRISVGGKEMKLPAGLAPASGLTLIEVSYDNLIE
jgi:tRNA pseudouridine38-40 synthase